MLPRKRSQVNGNGFSLVDPTQRTKDKLAVVLMMNVLKVSLKGSSLQFQDMQMISGPELLVILQNPAHKKSFQLSLQSVATNARQQEMSVQHATKLVTEVTPALAQLDSLLGKLLVRMLTNVLLKLATANMATV